MLWVLRLFLLTVHSGSEEFADEGLAHIGVDHVSNLRLHDAFRMKSGACPLALLLVPDHDGKPRCFQEQILHTLLRQAVGPAKWLAAPAFGWKPSLWFGWGSSPLCLGKKYE